MIIQFKKENVQPNDETRQQISVSPLVCPANQTLKFSEPFKKIIICGHSSGNTSLRRIYSLVPLAGIVVY